MKRGDVEVKLLQVYPIGGYAQPVGSKHEVEHKDAVEMVKCGMAEIVEPKKEKRGGKS